MKNLHAFHSQKKKGKNRRFDLYEFPVKAAGAFFSRDVIFIKKL